MNDSDSQTDSLILQTIASYISLVLNSVTLLLGTIGGACNLITFTSPRLRRSASAFYLMCMTIFQIISIVLIIPTRMALDNFHNDFENRSAIFCKIRYYLVLTLPELATFYLLLTFIDRCVATSTNAGMRSWSQLKVAHRLSILVLTVGPLRNIHVLVFYGIYNGKCQVNPTGAYIVFLAIYSLVVVIALPHTLMFVLAVMTVINTRRAQQRVLPASRLAPQRRLHRFEYRIFSIIILQVIVTSLSLLLRMGSYMYTILTSTSTHKTPADRAAESFALQLGVSLYHFSFATSFYVSTLSSKFFRVAFCRRIQRFYRHHCRPM